MELAHIAAQQVLELLLMILAGAVCCKAGVFQPKERSVLSNILLYLVVPAMVINSYLTEFDPNTFRNLLETFALSLLALGIGLAVTFIVTLPVKQNQAILRFACSFSNAAYMGFPLIKAMFGNEGLLYASAFVTVFNILLWTVGYGMVSGSHSFKEILHSIVTCPCILAVIVGLVLYLGRVAVPQVLAGPISSIGDMNTPLSMIITGATIASSNLGQLLKNRQLFLTLGLRLLLVPAVELAVFALLGVTGTVPMIVLLLEACPCVTITTVFAIRFHHDEELAAGAVVFSTLASILTLPLYALVLTAVLNV